MKELYLNDLLFGGTEEEFLAVKKFDIKTWELNGEIHREDGPAVICSDGERHWYQNGEWHREDGPARIYSDGTEFWYQNGLLHRDGGPAVIYSSGSRYWYKNGLLHRENGPATVHSSGRKFFYFEGLDFELLFPITHENGLYIYDKDNHSQEIKLSS